MSADRLDNLLPLLDYELRREVERLRMIEAWAFAQQPFKEGDQVTIKSAPGIGAGSGWWHCREFLVEGSTGTIVDVHCYDGKWGVLFKPEVQWVANERYGRRFEDRPSTFYFDPRLLRHRKPKDQPLTIPADTKPWREP